MKRIIDGKTYNTETAEEIGNYWNGLSDGDFRHINETLYITKRGNYFLAGEGGAMSKYSESNGNASWGSSKIIPLDKEEAMEWASSHLDADIVEEYFGDIIEEA